MKVDYCPNCQIGLNKIEQDMCFCQNCKYSWGYEKFINKTSRL